MVAVNMETYKYNSTFSLSEYWRIFTSYTNLGELYTSEYSPVFTSASGTIVYVDLLYMHLYAKTSSKLLVHALTHSLESHNKSLAVQWLQSTVQVQYYMIRGVLVARVPRRGFPTKLWGLGYPWWGQGPTQGADSTCTRIMYNVKKRAKHGVSGQRESPLTTRLDIPHHCDWTLTHIYEDVKFCNHDADFKSDGKEDSTPPSLME